MTKLTVPYVSQISDVTDSNWQNRSCTVANADMLLRYYRSDIGEAPTVNALIEEGIKIGAHDSKTGWNHVGVVRILRNHGLHAYTEEFRSQTINATTGDVEQNLHTEKLIASGIEKIARTTEEGNPVIVSVLPHFGANTGNHTVLVVGVERGGKDIKGFWYLDPYLTRPEGEEPVFVPLEKFKTHWRGLAIFANPPRNIA